MYPLRKPVDVDALLAEVYAAELLGLADDRYRCRCRRS
jgi:hypothetical protein